MLKQFLFKLGLWVIIVGCVLVGFIYYNKGEIPFGLGKYAIVREIVTYLPVREGRDKPGEKGATGRPVAKAPTAPGRIKTSTSTTGTVAATDAPAPQTVAPVITTQTTEPVIQTKPVTQPKATARTTTGTGTISGAEPTVITVGGKRIEFIPCSNGVYSICEAALAGNMEVLEARLAEGAAVDTVNELGQTPLHLAAMADKEEVLQRLVQAGANVLAKDKEGRTPLDYAKSKTVRGILEQAQVKLDEAQNLFGAVAQGDVGTLRAALQSGVNPNTASKDGTTTLLAAAITAKNAEAVKILLQAGANPGAVRRDGKSMLHVAAVEGTPGIVQTLLQAGADPMAKAKNGAYPIHDAVWRGRTDTLRALLPAYKDCNYSPTGGGGNPLPVIMAITKGNADAVKAFLDAGLNVNGPMFAKQPLLVVAAKGGREEMVKMLLAAGANKDAKDADGKTASQYAQGAILQLLQK